MVKENECEIMQNNRHQFIAGYNSKERAQFLQKLVADYPIILDNSIPGAIYLEEFGLPHTEMVVSNIDETMLSIIAREYLNFSLFYSLLDTTKKQIDLSRINERVMKFLNIVNRFFLNRNFNKLDNFEDLVDILRKIQLVYKDTYVQLLKSGTFSISYNELPIARLDMDFLLNYYKKMLNNDSYFCFIVDVHDKISLLSQKAINEFVTKRINRNISMKIVCDFNQWDTFYDLNGIKADYMHDYDIIDLDGNGTEYIRKRKMEIN